jgi:hypothetical protein
VRQTHLPSVKAKHKALREITISTHLPASLQHAVVLLLFVASAQ